jgi:hypothetical protein
MTSDSDMRAERESRPVGFDTQHSDLPKRCRFRGSEERAAFAALSSEVQCNWMLPLVNLPVLLKPSLTVRVTTPGVVALDS